MPPYLPERLVSPLVAPVTLAEARAHVRVDFDDDDARLQVLIETASELLDGYGGRLGRAIVDQVWRQSFDRLAPSLRLAMPAREIVAISVLDADRIETTLDPGLWRLLADARGSFIAFPAGVPAIRSRGPAGVTVQFACGWPADAVPRPLRHAILMLVALWYEQGEPINIGNIVNDLPYAVEALIAPFRRLSL